MDVSFPQAASADAEKHSSSVRLCDISKLPDCLETNFQVFLMAYRSSCACDEKPWYH